MDAVDSFIADPLEMCVALGVVFKTSHGDRAWKALIEARNAEFSAYLSPPSTATSLLEFEHNVNTGQVADTANRLTEKWARVLADYAEIAVMSGDAWKLVDGVGIGE